MTRGHGRTGPQEGGPGQGRRDDAPQPGGRPGAEPAQGEDRAFGASASTVSRALALLAQRGLVVSRPGAGTFRAAQEPASSSGDTTWQEAALALNPGLADGNPGA
ncbi:GntR family transcriptional regulator [Kocuria marina]|uniref:GntR family transcriptional regulator n=1 Tax=Kocuria marina TaxID=223184 RepID=UPI00164380EA|nr:MULTISPECIES: GntR family transcriptional regulator [Kocuria]MCT2021680.1 GntR family transcriptional regulator [Kocuria marina]